MKMLPCCLLVVLAVTVVPVVGQASVGTAFTYQGQLKKSGAPHNGSCDFQFALYDSLTGGTQIGSTQNVSSLAVTNGLFSVSLDFGPGAFAGDSRWLEISIQCAGDAGFTALLPRLPLLPTPYALYSANAAMAGDLQCAGCVSITDLGFDPATQTELDAHKASGDHDARYLQNTGGTLSGPLALPTSGLTVGTNQITTSGGHVGIGTAPVTGGSTSLSVAGMVRTGLANSAGCDLTLSDDICFFDEQNGTLSVRNFAGSAYATVKAASFSVASSASYKKDIDRVEAEDIRGMRAAIDELPLYRYRYQNEPESRTQHIGVIAERSPQEILAPDGKAVNLSDYLGLAVGATKELSRESDVMKKKLHELEKRNRELGDRNAALERRLDRLEKRLSR